MNSVSELVKYKLMKYLPDEPYLKLMYRWQMKKPLNLIAPHTFNEKLQWLKLYDRQTAYIGMVDKCEVKNYIAQEIGPQYIVPTLGVWNRFDDIDFNSLPEQFVLKCTHDSGGIIICKSKICFDKSNARRTIMKSLKRNFYWSGREWPYKNVKPRIMAEQYLVDSSVAELRDYKFFCFNGVCKCMKVDFDRFVSHKANYYDRHGNFLDIGEVVCPPDKNRDIALPDNLAEMVELAEKLSAGFPFVRVDLYNVEGKIKFGEFTFYPASGMGPFISESADILLGQWLELPRRKEPTI